MKRIVVCYDGTWNAVTKPNEVTNVVRVGQAVKAADEKGVAQVVYYNAGVGSGGPLDRFLGGVFGVGLRDNVKRGLAFLSLNWAPGDEIYIFGFSRGAYSARALAGVIGAINGIPKQEHFDRLEAVWDYYRLDPKQRKDPKNRAARKIDTYVHGQRSKDDGKPPIIKCLGVWDTVGSYAYLPGWGSARSRASSPHGRAAFTTTRSAAISRSLCIQWRSTSGAALFLPPPGSSARMATSVGGTSSRSGSRVRTPTSAVATTRAASPIWR